MKTKKKNSHKSKTGKNLNKKLLFFKKSFFMVFFNRPGRNSVWKFGEKSGETALPNLDYIISNIISQI